MQCFLAVLDTRSSRREARKRRRRDPRRSECGGRRAALNEVVGVQREALIAQQQRRSRGRADYSGATFQAPCLRSAAGARAARPGSARPGLPKGLTLSRRWVSFRRRRCRLMDGVACGGPRRAPRQRTVLFIPHRTLGARAGRPGGRASRDVPSSTPSFFTRRRAALRSFRVAPTL